MRAVSEHVIDIRPIID